MTRQFRYYLKLDLPEVAIRFKEAVKKTAKAISKQPQAAPPFPLLNPRFQGLRSRPVTGFEAIRFYFLVADGAVRVIRILHGKRDVRGILQKERMPGE
jgi:plasmid stabilization system protein ParE